MTEICPMCKAEVVEQRTSVTYDDIVEFVCALQRFVCACGWIWANDVQREANEKAYKKRRRQMFNPTPQG